MTKYYCDRCGKELDGENMKYTEISICDYSDPDSERERWIFCDDCALSVKQSMVKNLTDYEEKHN